MSDEEYKRLQSQCLPAVNNVPGPPFFPSTFAQAMLTKVVSAAFKTKSASFYDGAELLKGSTTSDNVLKITNNETPYSITFFSYIQGVPAAQNKSKVNVASSEICVFIEVAKDDKLAISIKVSEQFKTYLSNYYKSKKLTDVSKNVNTIAFPSDITSFKKHFGRVISHNSLFNFILKKLNVAVVPSTKYIISDAYFAKKEKDVFTKVKTAKLEDELYIVIEGKGVEGKNVAINILEKGNNIAIEKGNLRMLIPVTLENKQTTKITFPFPTKPNENGLCVASVKITLGAKELNDISKQYNNLANSDNKKAFVYLLADIHTVNKGVNLHDVTYQGKNSDPSSIPNFWLDNEGDYLEVGYCDCGYEYIGKFVCKEYGGSYGPVFWGTKKLNTFKGWDSLIRDKKVTEEEKDIVVAMSPNEGNLDAVQSYDFSDRKPMVLTAGAMQKTVDPEGNGDEFPKQVAAFKQDFSDKYQTLFENCGWTVKKGIMYYKEFSESEEITGKPLADLIRKNCNSDYVDKPIRCKPLEPIAKAIIDNDFQARQVIDFIGRLKKVMSYKPIGKDYVDYRLKDFLKSKLGKATALDHDVNRPAHVVYYFGEALNRFFAKKDKEIEEKNKDITDNSKKLPLLSKNPKDWGDNHSSFETEILEIYGPLRGRDEKEVPDIPKSLMKNGPMSNATKRYTDLKSRL